MANFNRVLSIALKMLLVAALTLSLLWFNARITEQERYECRTWSIDFQAYEHLRVDVAEWQYDQCRELEIPLPTP